MSNASKIMYTIGKVINVIEIIATALALLFGVLVLIFGESVIPDMTMLGELTAMTAGTGLTVGGVIALVLSVVTLILANNATRALENGRADNAPHIIMIVIGVLGDVFYLLGGIFGIVAENSREGYTA